MSLTGKKWDGTDLDLQTCGHRAVVMGMMGGVEKTIIAFLLEEVHIQDDKQDKTRHREP